MTRAGRPLKLVGADAEGAAEGEAFVASLDLTLRRAIALQRRSGVPILLIDEAGRFAGVCGEEEIYESLATLGSGRSLTALVAYGLLSRSAQSGQHLERRRLAAEFSRQRCDSQRRGAAVPVFVANLDPPHFSCWKSRASARNLRIRRAAPAEIVFADAGDRAQVDAGLIGERGYAHGDVAGDAEEQRAVDGVDMGDAVAAQIGRRQNRHLHPASLATRSAS